MIETNVDSSLNSFIRAVKQKYINYDGLDAWLACSTNEQRKETLTELKVLARRRGLGLSEEQADFGVLFLQSAISAATNHHGVLFRIKTRLGV